MSNKKIIPTSLPFWSWNDDLKKDKLIEQIRKMKKNGYGGFFMHARSGLVTEYLGEEWFDCVRACCEEAKKLGLKAWAYDENGWPSGFVGGKLLETKEFRLHFLNSTTGDFDEKATYHYLLKENVLVREECAQEGCFINVFDQESVSLVDILNDQVVDAFINETHEKYKKEIENLSDNIEGFFTDEPLYCQLGGFPFPTKLKDRYFELYGEDLLDNLGLLFSEQKGYEKFRYRYYKCCQELFLKNFAEKLYTWHDKNGLKLTGHYVEERTMFTQMLNNAGIMPYYEYLHMPGIDWLCRRYLRVNTIRQLTSVTAQLQKEFVLSEMFAMTGWDVTPKELKNIADYQYNYGVNMMCQHLLPYSERGERKNDYPAHFSSFNAWIDKGMASFNAYFDALGAWIRSSTEKVDVGVLFPIRSAYVKYDASNWTSLEDLDISYIDDGCERLANNHVAFHILDETLLAKYGCVEQAKIKLGACAYKTLIIPKCIVIDKTTDDILREYIKQGGKVLLLDCKPQFVDGEYANFDYLESNITFEEICKDNEYFVSNKSTNLHTSLRMVNGKKYVFAVNIGDEDLCTEIVFDNVNFNAVYNVINDEVSFVGNNIIVPAKESVIVCVYDGKSSEVKDFERIEIGTGDYSVIDFNANYLPLDFANFSYDGINFESSLPVVGIFRRLLEERHSGKVYLKYSFTLKEVVEEISILAEEVNKITAYLNGKKLDFEGVSKLDEIYSYANVADKIVVGKNEMIVEYDFYQDESVYFALFGEGVSESLRNCMTYNTMITAPYLCGKFGVYSDTFRKGMGKNIVHADEFVVGKPPKTVSNLVEQGFAFFAGNITLQRKFITNSNNVKLKFNGRYHIADISINGKEVDTLIFTDTIDVSNFVVKGENTLKIKLYSGNRNLLGPHHFAEFDTDNEVGPFLFDFTNTWTGNSSDAFADRYALSRFGLFDE